MDLEELTVIMVILTTPPEQNIDLRGDTRPLPPLVPLLADLSLLHTSIGQSPGAPLEATKVVGPPVRRSTWENTNY